MGRLRIRFTIGLVLMAALVGVQSTASGLSANSASSGEGYFAPASALAERRAVVPMAASTPIHAGSCYYRQAVDTPHISSTSISRAAQSHGWWVNAGGACPSKSNVDVYLQAVYCSGGTCGWRTVDVRSGDVYAGGGKGKRVTAHKGCSGTATVGFRSYVDVDLIGMNDPAGFTYSTPVDLACYPSK